MLSEMFPAMNYIQIVVSQKSRAVKKTLHYNGDAHQAARALCRPHLNWFQMVRTGHLPWPPPQGTKTKLSLGLKPNTTAGKGCGWWPWLLLPTAVSLWGGSYRTGCLWEGKDGHEVWASCSEEVISYKKKKGRDFQKHWMTRSFPSQLRSCWIRL